MRRREFLKLTAASAAGTVLFQACGGEPEREFKVQSPRNIPEDAQFGSDAWYASVCPGCGAGCGVIVRVFEGRAKKIEGNPNHPVNSGKLCPRGQALVQDLYHPDRITSPLRRTGERGLGQFEPISWDEALDVLAGQLRSRLDAGAGAEVLLVTEPLSGTPRVVAERFSSALGGRRMSFETLEKAPLREALRRVFGSPQLPELDLGNARFVLSFGADFLQTWLSPVHLSQGYSSFRRAQPTARGTLFQVEPRMSSTAANADRWIPILPGQEGLLALAIAGVVLEEGLAPEGGEAAFRQVIGQATLPSPDDAAAASGVPAESIRELARAFANSQPAMALGGGSAAAHTNGLANMVAIYALNLLVQTVNQPGGIQLNAPLPEGLAELDADQPVSYASWSELAQRMQNGTENISLLLVHQANPIYSLPAHSGFAEALGNVETIVSFSRYVDETSAYADLVLPDSTALESWGDLLPALQPGQLTIGFQQPVVPPFYDTRTFGDVLLTLAEELGGGVLEALPWTTMQAATQATADMLRPQGGGNIEGADFPIFWAELLRTGVWISETEPTVATPAEQPVGAQPTPEFAGDETEYPLHLLPYPSPTLEAGEHSHLPWLQALPDPLTTATWASWAELNPDLADELGVGTNDLLRVISPQGEVEVPAYVLPSAPPGTVAIPMGQGHAFYGRYAAGRGINVFDLVAPLTVADTGALAWSATRVRVEKVAGRQILPRFEGVRVRQDEEYQVVRTTRGEQ